MVRIIEGHGRLMTRMPPLPFSSFHFASGFVDKTFSLLPGLDSDVRALVVKDIRMFWRDTTQWGQSLMLFGLLGVYILNLRHFTSQISSEFWLHLTSYLNLAACSLNLATLTTRFVFPQFSLEGKRLWIVGRAPLGLIEVVQTKFLLVTGASLVVTLGMIALSCHMLNMPPERTAYFAGAITVMTLTLNALALGIGVLYPNLREDNPSKIVSGFGGTLCLVLSFVYVLAAVTLLAFGSPWSRLGFRSESLRLASWGATTRLLAVMIEPVAADVKAMVETTATGRANRPVRPDLPQRQRRADSRPVRGTILLRCKTVKPLT